MPLPVLPSKLVWERVRVEFDFADQLEFNETITSWSVEVFVNSGTDPAPKDMIATRRFQDGARLFQWVIGGIPGNIYRLVNTAVGTTGKVYKLEKLLAILPTEFVRPPLFGIVYTTTPYPVDVLESLNVSGMFSEGLLWNPPLDNMDVSVAITDGSLRNPLVTYGMRVEALDLSARFLSGSLVVPLVTYPNYRPEALDLSAFLINGTLKVVVINYPNYRPESLDVSAQITGGSLI